MRVCTPITIRYGETDMMGVVYHANYLLYFEDARTAFLEALGYPYARIEEAGLMSPVTHMECDYREPLRYGEGAVVRTRAVLEAQGIDCSGKAARRLRRADADEWDLFVGMDEANMRDMRRQLGRGAEGRCRKLLEYAGSERDVADPWYTGDFDATYDDVFAGCTGLLSALVAREGAGGRG